MGRRRAAAIIIWAVIAIGCCVGAQSLSAADISRCEGQRFDLVTAQGGVSPYINLTAGTYKGAFLLDYGSTVSSMSASVVRRDARSNPEFVTDKFSLPSFPRARFQISKYWTQYEPQGGQLGVVGTDFLALLTADFSFRKDGGDVVIGPKPCSDLIPRVRGMTPVHQTGFFSSNPKTLRSGIPDVPVLFLDVGGVSTWAQIDTGYEDTRYKPAIDINDALYQKLVAHGVVLNRIGGVRISTCQGVEQRQVYVAPQTNVRLKSDDGATLMDLKDAKLIRKVRNGCGGIATMSEPAAQLGASIVARFGAMIFDPHNETVWVGRPRF